MINKVLVTAVMLFVSAAVSAEEVNLLCKGQRTSAIVPSLNGPDTQNIVLTKKDGKVIKAVVLEFDNTYTLKKTNTQTDKSKPPHYAQLVVEADKLILRDTSSDGTVLDAVIHNSGKFNADVGISRIVGQCEQKQKLF